MEDQNIKSQVAQGIAQAKQAEQAGGCVSCLTFAGLIWLVAELNIDSALTGIISIVVALILGVAVYQAVLKKK